MSKQHFDEALYIFEKEYDYPASFKVISEALETVEPGVTERFVTSFEKQENPSDSNLNIQENIPG